MQTVAHRAPRLPRWAHNRVTIWLVGAVLVAAVATILVLALVGSDDTQADRGGGASQPSQQAPAPIGGPRP
jgi:type II secretory pathway component PulL